MTSALTTTRPRSWKDYLMGTGLRADVQAQGVDNFYGEEDLETLNCVWAIPYGVMQYLTVQPRSVDINTSQPYPSLVMAWIRLPGLLGHMYKRQILWEIGGMVGKVVNLDLNTDTGLGEDLHEWQ
ncbi:hypothetical protein Gohar_001188, partial [Gossypium harknessii]|nr:hypothetical protein [Gossypium harknessii]